ncbi:LINE-1 reverse transcriptase homolog [Eumeta japonica]|uniref:LINE-1 reverse transcriptase homolog n=1 Tax=Eumeta variegata TaxID=151549 RepID=A0A4C1YET4_EUMVA|nr:LINE-1 reverse transcriptase homolog [Eumeta japonica]
MYEHNTAQDKDDLTGTSNIPYILYNEVIKTIDSQKSDKVPGHDGITNEILKESKGFITPVLTDTFNEILNTETIPQQWTETNIILLYKKGDKYEIDNYRPISLICNIYKLFAKIILNRIEKRLDEHQHIEQAGFRKDYSVLDHIHVVRQVMEKYKEYQYIYYIAFIDYSKAFDSLFHEKIWAALNEQGIGHKYIRLIKKMFTARVQRESNLKRKWYPRQGKRKRGRPQKRWEDDIRQAAGVTWNRVTQDRHEWKRLEEAFADWQTDLQKKGKIKY